MAGLANSLQMNEMQLNRKPGGGRRAVHIGRTFYPLWYQHLLLTDWTAGPK